MPNNRAQQPRRHPRSEARNATPTSPAERNKKLSHDHPRFEVEPRAAIDFADGIKQEMDAVLRTIERGKP